jgi:putative FmdB family regulatory protein
MLQPCRTEEDVVPTYQYACTECGEELEVVQSFTSEPLTECPRCGGRLRKVFHPVGVVFKGSGFYRTDSRGSSKARTGSSSSDKKVSGSSDSSGSGSTGSGSTGSGSTGSGSTGSGSTGSGSSGSGGSTSS